jgi:hypothetical protein
MDVVGRHRVGRGLPLLDSVLQEGERIHLRGARDIVPAAMSDIEAKKCPRGSVPMIAASPTIVWSKDAYRQSRDLHPPK